MSRSKLCELIAKASPKLSLGEGDKVLIGVKASLMLGLQWQ